MMNAEPQVNPHLQEFIDAMAELLAEDYLTRERKAKDETEEADDAAA